MKLQVKRDRPQNLVLPVISCFVQTEPAGKRPVVYGDGGHSCDFIFIENVVDANLPACEAKDVGGMVFNAEKSDGSRRKREHLRVHCH